MSCIPAGSATGPFLRLNQRKDKEKKETKQIKKRGDAARCRVWGITPKRVVTRHLFYDSARSSRIDPEKVNMMLQATNSAAKHKLWRVARRDWDAKVDVMPLSLPRQATIGGESKAHGCSAQPPGAGQRLKASNHCIHVLMSAPSRTDDLPKATTFQGSSWHASRWQTARGILRFLVKLLGRAPLAVPVHRPDPLPKDEL